MVLLPLIGLAQAFDPTHARLQAVLSADLADGRVDYAAIKAAPAALDAYLADIATAPLATLSPAETKALLINAYNACTIDVVADNLPLKSIRDLDGGKVWDTRTCTVGGLKLTLNDIEQRRLRPLGDPRIHAALNCASLGCPPLAPTVFTGAGLDAQLDAAARRWAATATLGRALTVSQIFDWYGDDFTPTFGASLFDIPGLAGKAEAAANFVARYAPTKAAAIQKGGFDVVYAPYDWAVNAK